MKPSEKAARAVALAIATRPGISTPEIAAIIARETGCDEMRELLERLRKAAETYVRFATVANLEKLETLLGAAELFTIATKPEPPTK